MFVYETISIQTTGLLKNNLQVPPLYTFDDAINVAGVVKDR